jgi:hypothetical protein
MFTDAKDALTFITGGNAKVTFKSLATGNHFSFKIAKPTRTTDRGGKARDHDSDVAFVSVLTGDPSNWQDWQFIGTVFLKDTPSFRHGKKISADAPSVKAFNWVFGHLTLGSLPPKADIQHSGSCCRCGRELTHPASIQNGIGPECIKHFS